MKIGIAGPISLNLVKHNFKNVTFPQSYDFPLIAFFVNVLLYRGFEIIIYTTSVEINEPSVFESDQLTICIAPRRKTHVARDFFKVERKNLLNLMLKYKGDIIHANWSYEFAWAAIDTKIPTLVTLHDHALTILKYSFDPYRFIRFIMDKIVLGKARYLSANSEHIFELLPQKYKSRARIINNFYTPDLIAPFVLIENKKYIISVNNGFGRLKNIKNALKAFKIIRNKFPQLEYYLIGNDMEENGKAFYYAIKNSLNLGVKFLGKLNFKEVRKYISEAKIFLHTSREESFGMSVLESMVRGTAVVGGEKSGNIPYLLNHGKAGLLCNINSPVLIADAVIKLYSDNHLNENLRKNAFEFAQNNFSEDKIVDKYISYYKEILKEN